MVEKKSNVIMLAAGGTGGHIFPAYALAEELNRRGFRVVLVTDKRSAEYKIDDLETYIISTSTLSGNIWRKIISGFKILRGFLEARRLIKHLQPLAVVGFGGYPSFPTMLAAISKKNLKTIIHEQNAVLGRANRLLSQYVDEIVVSMDSTTGFKDEDKDKIKVSGNPVRISVRSLRSVPYPDIVDDGELRIFVVGGSQGASIFGDVIPEALLLMPKPLRGRINLVMQCRADKIDAVRKRLDKIGIKAELKTFFNDIPDRLAKAHLVISRAGASTVSELLTAGRPAILVPFPAALDDHQTANANAMEDCGGGWLMPQLSFTPEAVAARIEGFIRLPSILTQAAEKAHDAGEKDAAKSLADIVVGDD
jgi:UDP-N-acetylglucosamine--N-acetylmuramyl-(pentapeptide) pyrophosphoryl-undecaprenol N-acetylglucosamine transferase